MATRKKRGADQGVTCTIDPTVICPLINSLASESGTEREKARTALGNLGRPEVSIPLMEALADERDRVRWEAAKTLKHLADPATAPALVRALRDDSFDVRWVAAEALIAMKRKGLLPLLWALVQHPESVWLREGAQHVLGKLAKGSLKSVVKPVHDSLNSPHPEMMVPQAAVKALEALTEKADTAPAEGSA